MAEPRKGRQTPTKSVVLPYSETIGQEAIDLYNSSGRTALEWQEIQIYDIMAVNEEGLWVHTKYGYSVSRRNGKNEVVLIRELHGLTHGERVLHTAHRTTTSSSASKRLAAVLDAAGYTEVIRAKKDEKYDKHYTYTKQLGLERITLLGDGGGTVDFRTRSSKGGLGEGFDLLIIDEAQEYTDDQESALKYVVTASKNPQTIFCGTPPTAVSAGTVFQYMRENALAGKMKNTGWAEWSVDHLSDPHDVDLWYEANPSLGTIFTERSVRDEVGSDNIDFNIQRLGLWLKYNQKSEISRREWDELQVAKLPEITGKLHIGIKYGKDGRNVAMSLAVATTDGRIFVECRDCRPIKDGTDWMTAFIRASDVKRVLIDGANGQTVLQKAMADAGIKKAPILLKVAQVVTANATFEQGLFAKHLCHAGQPSLAWAVSNCTKRAIGSNGGFGYASTRDDIDIAIMDSMIYAYWSCNAYANRKKQKIYSV